MLSLQSLYGLEKSIFVFLKRTIVRKSSTYRELRGFLSLLDNAVFSEIIRSHTERFNMDRKGAVANLIHSGPKKELLSVGAIGLEEV